METISSQLNDGLPASPLLRLPYEIRLMIYEHLLLPSTSPSTGNGTSIANLLPDFHTYLSEDTNSSASTLSVRTIDPWFGAQGPKTWRRRSTYHIRTGEFFEHLLSIWRREKEAEEERQIHTEQKDGPMHLQAAL